MFLDEAIERYNESEQGKGGLSDEARERIDSRRARLRAEGVNVQ